MSFSKDLALTIQTVLGEMGIKQGKNCKTNMGTQFCFMQASDFVIYYLNMNMSFVALSTICDSGLHIIK